MNPKTLPIACAASLLCSAAAGQTFAPRSADYLFAATADDARAIWVNPAGLAVLPQASILGEFVVQRPAVGDMRVSQISLGFNSQGLAFGYNRERLVTGSSIHTYRFALARPFRGWTLGVSASHFRSGINATSFDAGIRYRLLPSLHAGLVLRNIGQPEIRLDTLPLAGVGSLGWMVLPGTLLLKGEAVATNRLTDAGYDMSYRAGLQFSVGRAIPVVGIAAVHLGDRLGVNLWTFGFALGRDRRGILVADVAPPNGTSPRLETVSVTAMAINELPVRR